MLESYYSKGGIKMLETFKDILLLLVGAGLSLLGGWVESNRSRKQILEDTRREKEAQAREVRLKEGEEMIKNLSRLFYYFSQASEDLINADSIKGLKIEEIMGEGMKMLNELDKGAIIYKSSIKSLQDDQLIEACRKTDISFGAYRAFVLDLGKLIGEKRRPFTEEERATYKKKEKKIKNSFYLSAEEFFCRINELRSQWR
jgi:heme exporter protein D